MVTRKKSVERLTSGPELNPYSFVSGEDAGEIYACVSSSFAHNLKRDFEDVPTKQSQWATSQEVPAFCG